MEVSTSPISTVIWKELGMINMDGDGCDVQDGRYGYGGAYGWGWLWLMLMQVGAMTWFLKWEGRYKCGVGLETVHTIFFAK